MTATRAPESMSEAITAVLVDLLDSAQISHRDLAIATGRRRRYWAARLEGRKPLMFEDIDAITAALPGPDTVGLFDILDSARERLKQGSEH